MRLYTLQPEGFDTIKKRIQSRIYPCGLLILAAMAYVVNIQQPMSALTWVIALGVSVPMIFGALFYAMRKALQKEQLAWDTYRLEMRDDSIIRKVATLPDMEIRRDRIVSVQEAPDGCLVVKGTGKYECILVPGSLEGLKEFRRQIDQWHTVTQPAAPRTATLKALVPPFAMVGLLVVVYISRDRFVTAVAGTLFCTGIIGFLVSVWRNPHYERRIKLGMLWLLVIAAPIAYTVVNIVTH